MLQKKFLVLAFCLLPACGMAATCPQDTYATHFLGQGDFDALNAGLAACLADYKQGRITAEQLYKKLEEAPKSFPKDEALFNKWVDKYPGSYVATTSRAIYFYRYAWDARGEQYAGVTPKEKMEAFSQYLLRSRDDALASLNMDDRQVISYWLAVNIAKGIGAVDVARKYRDEAVRLDPKLFGIRKAYLSAATPKWGGSIELMDAALQEALASGMSEADKDSFHAEYYGHLADYLRSYDKTPEAIDTLLKAFAVNPGNKTFLNRAAKWAEEIGDYKKAVQIYTAALEIDPKDAWVLGKRGYIYEKTLNDPAKAIADYRLAAEQGDAWAMGKMGYIYMSGVLVVRDIPLARKYLVAAVEKGNKNAQKNLNYLDAKLARGEDAQGVAP